MSALLIDLDDTLLPDTQVRDAALVHVLRLGGSRLNADRALVAIRGSWHDCAARLLPGMAGVSSWEALWTDFAASGLDTSQRSAGHLFQETVWRQLLPKIPPEEAAQAFVSARESRIAPYSWAAARLTQLGSQYNLWCVTNGSSYLQRRKLALSRLDIHFIQVLISGEVGDTKASTAFATAVHRAVDAQHDTPVRLIGDSPASDGHLASALGVPFEQVTPGVAF